MNRTGASAAMTDYASDTVGRHAKGLKGEERGMIKIFIGAILALLDFTVTNGSMRFGILPDFIGCFLLYLGFKDIMAAYPKTCQRLVTAIHLHHESSRWLHLYRTRTYTMTVPPHSENHQ